MKFWKKGIAFILVCIMICECLFSVNNGMAAENIYRMEKDGIIYNQGSAMENSREIGDFILYGATLYVSAGITHFSVYGYRRYHTMENTELSVDIALLTPDGNVMTMMSAVTADPKQYETVIFQAEVNGDYSHAYDYTLDYEGNGTLNLPNDTIDNTLRNSNMCLMPGESYTLMSNERAEKVSYQWYYTTDRADKGKRIEGADQYFYRLENVSEEDIGYYYCRVYKNGQVTETTKILVDVELESDQREEILSQASQEVLPDYVIEQTDGKLINKCAAFRRERYIDKYYIYNIWFYQENGQSTLLAKLEDVSEETEVAEDAPSVRLCTIYFYNIAGKEIASMGGIIGQTKAGETAILNASATRNFIEAYDFRIEFEDTLVAEDVVVDQTIRKKWDVENQMLWLQCREASEGASYLWYRSDYPDVPGEYFLYGQTVQFGLELDPEYDGYYYCRIWKNGIVKETERVHISMADYMQFPESACTPEPTPTMKAFATPEPTATEGVKPSATPEPTATEGVEPSITPEPTATEGVEPSITPEPTATEGVEPSAPPKPTVTPKTTDFIQMSPTSFNSVPISCMVQQTTACKAKIKWKTAVGGRNYRIMRAEKRNGTYRQIAALPTKKNKTSMSYIDHGVKRGKTYYYKILAQMTDTQEQMNLSKGVPQKIVIAWYKTPVLRVQKKKSSFGQKYVQLTLKKYEGKYAQIQMKSNGKYHTIVVKKKTIKAYRGKYKLRYQIGGRALAFRVRTYKAVKGNRRYSQYSRTVRIKL